MRADFWVGDCMGICPHYFLYLIFVMSRGWCGRLCPVGAFDSLIHA